MALATRGDSGRTWGSGPPCADADAPTALHTTSAVARSKRVRIVLDIAVTPAKMPPFMDPYIPAEPLETSLTLLARARAGDEAALERLLERYRPRLVRWAAGRLPSGTRDLVETQDIVQETLLQAFRRIGAIEIRGEGALQAYLRQALLNRIRMEIRRAARKPGGEPCPEEMPSPAPSPAEHAIGREALDRYERALATLRESDRELVIGHVELGYSHEELARVCGKRSPNTARIALRRALLRLAVAMGGLR